MKMERHEGWGQAKDIEKYYSERSKAGETYLEMHRRLTVVDHEMAAYGDWTLYQDDDGNYWESYFSIGD